MSGKLIHFCASLKHFICYPWDGVKSVDNIISQLCSNLEQGVQVKRIKEKLLLYL